jgi:hypothetical protein
MAAEPDDSKLYYDPAVAGKPVEADGGSLLDAGDEGFTVNAATREAFAGILTGRRMDVGDPPWRWLEIGDLTEMPPSFTARTVWCEESFIYFVDE